MFYNTTEKFLFAVNKIKKSVPDVSYHSLSSWSMSIYLLSPGWRIDALWKVLVLENQQLELQIKQL